MKVFLKICKKKQSPSFYKKSRYTERNQTRLLGMLPFLMNSQDGDGETTRCKEQSKKCMPA